MTQEMWEDLLLKIKNSCKDFTIKELPLMDHMGNVIDKGTLVEVSFSVSDGRCFLLKRERKPKVLDAHTNYSGRAGTSANVSYTVSTTDFTDRVDLFTKEDEWEDEWTQVSLDKLFGN